jgi:hypothetical protein
LYCLLYFIVYCIELNCVLLVLLLFCYRYVLHCVVFITLYGKCVGDIFEGGGVLRETRTLIERGVTKYGFCTKKITIDLIICATVFRDRRIILQQGKCYSL